MLRSPLRYLLVIGLVAVLAVGGFVLYRFLPTPTPAPEPVPRKSWTERGFTEGWMGYNQFGSLTFTTDRATVLDPIRAYKGTHAVTDASLRDLPDDGEPLALDLYPSQVTDAGLKYLKPLKGLVYLNLKEVLLVTGPGLRDLAGLDRLAIIHLPDRPTDAVLQALGEAKLLHTLAEAKGRDGKRVTRQDDITSLALNIDQTTTGAGFKELSGLKNMTTLTLRGYQWTGVGLKELAGVESLVTLHVSVVRDADGLRELGDLKQLRTIDLDEHHRLTDAELAAFRQVGVLHKLVHATGKDGQRPARVEDVTSFDMGFKGATDVTDAGLKEMTALPNLEHLDLRWTSVTGEGFGELTELKHLSSLRLGFAMPYENLDRLTVLKNLTALDLSGLNMPGAAVPKLAALKNLSSLNLSGTKVVGFSLPELAALANLKVLRLAGLSVSAEDLKRFTTLTVLDLRGVRITSLKGLAGLKNLEAIDLRGSQVPGSELKELAAFKQLKFVGLDDMQITDEALRSLREANLLHAVPQAKTKDHRQPTESGEVTVTPGKPPANADEVVTFELYNSHVTDAGLNELTGLKNLTSLSLNYRITDAGLKHLAKLKNLTALELRDTLATDAGLKDLTGLEKLTTLGLPSKCTDAGLKDVAGMKSLTTLSVNNQVTDGGLKELAGLPNLETLTLGSGVTGVGLKDLAGSKNLKAVRLYRDRDGRPLEMKHLKELMSLERLDLSHSGLPDSALKDLAELTHLTELELGGNKITDAGLKDLASLKGLTVLVLYNNPVTYKGLLELRSALPGCRIRADSWNPNR